MSDGLKMRCKVVVSGDIVEMYFYKVPIVCGNKRKHEITKNSREEQEKRNDNLYRARQNIRRIVWSNQSKYTKFVTLTYAKTTLDIKKVRRDITTFVQGMRRCGYDMKYLYVLENQKERGKKENNNGCIHVHMLLFIDKYIPKQDLEKCWKHGYIGIEKIDNVRNLGAYVCKYITKDNLAEFGKRCYSCSIGLDRPCDERFYTWGFSDSVTALRFQPEDVLRSINVTYSATMNSDFFDINGEPVNQSVRYFQGKWKQGNVIQENANLSDLMLQFDNLIK